MRFLPIFVIVLTFCAGLGVAEERAREGAARLEEYRRLKGEMTRLEAEAEEVGKKFKDWQPVEDKREMFAARASVDGVRHQKVDAAADLVATLEKALGFEGTNARARELLAAYYWDRYEEAERQGADMHLEMHRDTCTETPEKTYAIAEGFKKAKGYYPRINFDFSHPGSLKHLDDGNYIDRLFENVPLFQQSTLWHMRPFNGHHCQVPVTDGKGNFTPEYEEMRPFIRQGLDHWLSGPRPTNELWVVPEMGPKFGYGLSCCPDSWQDAIVLGNDIRKIWKEAVAQT